METIKSFTDFEQSKKLTEILPIESADMQYISFRHRNDTIEWIPQLGTPSKYDIPCWSLVALLSVLPKEIEIDGQHYAPCLFPVKSKWLLKLWYNSNYTITSPIAIFSDNPVDACYKLILKLNELNFL